MIEQKTIITPETRSDPELIALLLTQVESTEGALRFFENTEAITAIRKEVTKIGWVDLGVITRFRTWFGNRHLQFATNDDNVEVHAIKQDGGHYAFVIWEFHDSQPKNGSFVAIHCYTTKPEDDEPNQWFQDVEFQDPWTVIHRDFSHDGVLWMIEAAKNAGMPYDLTYCHGRCITDSFEDMKPINGVSVNNSELLKEAVAKVFGENVAQVCSGVDAVTVVDEFTSFKVVTETRFDSFGSIVSFDLARDGMNYMFYDGIFMELFGPIEKKEQNQKLVEELVEHYKNLIQLQHLKVMAEHAKPVHPVEKPKDKRGFFERIFDWFT